MTTTQLNNLIEQLEDEMYDNPAYQGDNIDAWFDMCNKELDRLAAIGQITYEQYCWAEQELGF